MRWLFVALALAGCDKLLLSEIPITIDAPAEGHDEDDDGVGDAIDTCPTMKGPQTDGDQDGVGDICDPEPNAQNRIAALYTFAATELAFVALTGSWTATMDTLVHKGTNQFSKYFAKNGLVLAPPYTVEARWRFDKAPDYAEFSISAALDDNADGAFCTILFQPDKTEIHAYNPGHDAVTTRMPPLDRTAVFTARLTAEAMSLRCAITSSIDGEVAATAEDTAVATGFVGFESRHPDTTTDYMIIYTRAP